MSKATKGVAPGIYMVLVCGSEALPSKDGNGTLVRLCFDLVAPREEKDAASMEWKVQGLESFEELKWSLARLGVELAHYDGIRAACVEAVDKAAYAHILSPRKVRLMQGIVGRPLFSKYWEKLSPSALRSRHAELGLEQFLT